MKEIFTMSKQPVAKVDRSGFGLGRLSGMITFVILINQLKNNNYNKNQPANLYANLKTVYKKHNKLK